MQEIRYIFNITCNIFISEQVTIVTQVTGATGYGPHPVSMVCPHCQAQITTSTVDKIGTMVWVVIGVILLIGYVKIESHIMINTYYISHSVLLQKYWPLFGRKGSREQSINCCNNYEWADYRLSCTFQHLSLS